MINKSISDPKQFRNNVIEKLFKTYKDKTISTNLEKGIYNYSIRIAKKKKLFVNGKIIILYNLY